MGHYMGHSPGKENPNWQALKDHVEGVTNRTEQHVRYLVPAIPQITVYARLAGLLHDLGKYRDEFQIHRLKWHPHEERHDPSFEEKPCPHSDAGARLMAAEFEMDGEERSELPFIIANHHGKLTDTAALDARLKQTKVEETHELFAKAVQDTSEVEDLLQDLPDLPLEGTERAFLIRVLFSALVDADRLDTEGHGSPGKAALRSEYDKQAAEMGLLFERLQAHMQSKNGGEKANEPINVLRREMYEAALSHAGDSTGFFRLTMPTGGGKTLTSLAFALAHAQAHGLRRVVYGVPFTTIIDQTAQVFRDVLEQNDFKVLEHHSNLEPEKPRNAGEEDKQTLAELSTENWDAPVIVTTTVRLFQETLFGTRTAQLRRLHNLTGSVIVLDEAQTLPTGLLTPTLDALQFLVKYCGCSVVLCTATQPALDERLGFPALKNIRDLIDDTDYFFEQLKRVDYHFRTAEPTSWADLATELGGLSQVLCIVNTRQHAQELFETLGDTRANFHLSTNMVPHHRKRVLAIIRHRLRHGKPCRVISTQLIEAGVDVDFPTVYRAMGPLEAIVQAAGRCNREGKLADYPSKRGTSRARRLQFSGLGW
ncbi:CRISPR-associated endonuclease Cas3'', partial [Deinococcus piscis]|uniref:CRISPR-associated endonuclease Cas3'' n=1 Tax=Deinococcus piscis TaxID=394230 RepID=UPI001673965F